MKRKPKNISIRLTAAEEAALRKIASHHGSLSRHGRTSGAPSWRILVQDIAAGRLFVVKGGAA